MFSTRNIQRAAALLPFVLWAASASVATAAPSTYDLSWSALDPRDDWSAQIIQSIFPIAGAPAATYAIGSEATVIGTLVGTLTGFVSAIAMAFLCYSVIMQIHRGSETGRMLSNNMTAMAVVRLGTAAVLMYPLSTGFSAGQEMVVRTALWGAGMARTVYTTAVQAIGPDAMVIADPIIPGTKTIVSGLIQAEFCRAIVNAAAGREVVPIPAPTAVGDPINGSGTTWAYTMATGDSTGSPACGAISVRAPRTGAMTLASVNMDMAAEQQSILEYIMEIDIRSQVQDVATAFWTDKTAASLIPLMDVLTTATADYTSQLTESASAKAGELRTALADPTAARAGSVGLIDSETKLSTLGWTSAGAYYLAFARLNGQVLSLMSAVPIVNMPSYKGLGGSLTADIAPLVGAKDAYMQKLNTYVQTSDGLDAPGGYSDLFTGSAPGADGSDTIERVFKGLRLNDRLLEAFVSGMSPTGNNWTDPFSALMQLGHKMIVLAVSAYGAAGLMASDTGTALGATSALFTSGPVTAFGVVVGHLIISFLAVPIFLLLTAILIPGMTLAFVMPMVPWVMWMAGVTGWLILVCEAVIAVPLWMLAHMTMQGEGLHGRANEGYALIFNVLFRPTLMILGLFLGYFIFAASSWLIRMSFGIAAGFVLENGWLVTNVLGVVVLLSMFVTIHIVAALQSFRMISLIPHHLPRIIGFASGGRVDMEQYARDAAIVGVAGSLKQIQRGTSGAMNSLTAGPTQARIGQGQKQIGNSSSDSGSGSQAGNGMDSTLRAATDNSTNADGEA